MDTVANRLWAASGHETLDHVHQQWVATLDGIRDAICVIDDTQCIIRANTSCSQLTGRSFENLIGCYLQDAMPWLLENNALAQSGVSTAPDGRVFRIRTSGGQTGFKDTILILEDISAEAALQQAQELHDAAQKHSLIKTIEALSGAIEAKDPYTAGHNRGVATLAEKIALRTGMGDIAARGIYYGALIHDIGKLSIPSGILSRSGPLAQAELNLMYTHSESGYAIVKNLQFPWPVHEIVLQHHERLDGSGYPSGLTGDEIHPAAKIVMVADVFDAMVSQRPYRAALGVAKATEELAAGRGIRYDAAAVDACLAVVADESKVAASVAPAYT